ncbi:MAG: GtrA family protein, partial [Pseudomonadota bacterium]
MIGREFLVYFTVVATGTLLDIAVAWGLSEMLGWPAPIAAMIGVLAGALVVYFGHEYWTFAQAEPSVSKTRFTKFCLTVAAVLGVRA